MKPGFNNPVLDAQAGFRALMEAMARPGRSQRVIPPPDLPAGLEPAAAATILTLADAETPLWTDAGEEARAWIAFHTGAPLVAEPGAAMLLLNVQPAMPPLLSLLAGEDEAPQEGATLIRQVEGLSEGSGWRLAGPGIEREHRLAVTGLPQDFLAQWRANAARFPRGVDVVLCAGAALAALPRSLALREGG
ncbi:MAG TPA: phosphonate C-P lyase system protein PhnH [Roseococcus sp.]|jgi:alpha-D-ribose 1-methylphosphonate 5-triphosphate synthase subunit PhnH|nr:phosphonate C-P lyase system protein PhnH [Roseococcus sp.]